MTRFLLDTGSAGDYIDRRRGVYERAREAVAAATGSASASRSSQSCGTGSRTAAPGSERRAAAAGVADLVVWPLTEQAAEAYGRIAAELKRAGRPIGKIDMLIAAIALSLGKTTVVSADRDLTAVPGANSRELGRDVRWHETINRQDFTVHAGEGSAGVRYA